MILELSLLGAIVSASWLLSLSAASAVSVILATLVFFSRSVPVSILFLLSLNIIAFIQGAMGGRRGETGRAQKRYAMVFFGTFCALLGSALPAPAWSDPMIFLGLLLAISNAASSLFFYEHYESLRLQAYFQSIAIPSLVAINILLKVKSGIKAEYAQLWDVTLLVLGLGTFIISSMLAMSKRRLKEVFIYISQAWIGLLLFLLVIDAGPTTDAAFAALAITAVSTIALLEVGSKLSGSYFSFAKIASLGLPGTVGFTALYLALRLTIGLNIVWLLVLGVGYIIQAVTLIGVRPGQVASSRNLKIRYWLLVIAQFGAGSFIFWLDKGGLK